MGRKEPPGRGGDDFITVMFINWGEGDEVADEKLDCAGKRGCRIGVWVDVISMASVSLKRGAKGNTCGVGCATVGVSSESNTAETC
jgi:hypothetical protein